MATFEISAEAAKSSIGSTTTTRDSVELKNLIGIDTCLIKSSLAFRRIIDEIIGLWLGSLINWSFERVYTHGSRSVSLNSNSSVNEK